MKDLWVFAESFLKCDNEPNTKALQGAVIHACVGVGVIPQGPREGDHMANGPVEVGCERSETTMQNSQNFS